MYSTEDEVTEANDKVLLAVTSELRATIVALVQENNELKRLGSDMADELEANYNNQITRLMVTKWYKATGEINDE